MSIEQKQADLLRKVSRPLTRLGAGVFLGALALGGRAKPAEAQPLNLADPRSGGDLSGPVVNEPNRKGVESWPSRLAGVESLETPTADEVKNLQETKADFPTPSYVIGQAADLGVSVDNIFQLSNKDSDLYKKVSNQEGFQKMASQLNAVANYANQKTGIKFDIATAFTIDNKGQLLSAGLVKEEVPEGKLPKRYVLYGIKKIGNRSVGVIYGLKLPDDSNMIVDIVSFDVKANGEVITRVLKAAYMSADRKQYFGLIVDPLSIDPQTKLSKDIQPTPEPLIQASAGNIDGVVLVSNNIKGIENDGKVDIEPGDNLGANPDAGGSVEKTAWEKAGVSKDIYLSYLNYALQQLPDKIQARMQLTSEDPNAIAFDFKRDGFVDQRGRVWRPNLTEDPNDIEAGWVAEMDSYYSKENNTYIILEGNPDTLGARKTGTKFKDLDFTDDFKSKIGEWISKYGTKIKGQVVHLTFVESLSKSKKSDVVATTKSFRTSKEEIIVEALQSSHFGYHKFIRLYASGKIEDPATKAKIGDQDIFSMVIRDGLILANNGYEGVSPASSIFDHKNDDSANFLLPRDESSHILKFAYSLVEISS